MKPLLTPVVLFLFLSSSLGSSVGSLAFVPAPVTTMFELPIPSGRYAVGTTTWHVTDGSRTETLAPSAGLRQIEVMAWYPAAAHSGATAPYLREGLTDVRTFATLLRAPATSFDDLAGVLTHATLDAPPLASGRRFPVLTFSHGYTASPVAYTALCEDLASHGYAVLSIVHPYEATAATLADGRVVSLLDGTGSPIAAIRDVFGEWGAEDQTMASVTRATTDDERLRLLRGYLGGLAHTNAALTRWVADTRVVLDQLRDLLASTPAGRLVARLDLSRLGAFGHSMGGVTAAQFCLEDARCRAGLNLDGIPQYGTMIDRTMPRPFLMVYSARPGRAGASDVIYQRAARAYYRVDVAGTQHLDFSDMTFWGGPLRTVPALGTISPARVTAITARIVREYFDEVLLGQRSPLLSGTSNVPELTVTTPHKPKR